MRRVYENGGKTAPGRHAGERGAGAVEYLVAILLIAAVTGVLVTSPLGEQVKRHTLAALCRVAEAGRIGTCQAVAPTPVPQPVALDPDIPRSSCLTSIDNEYVEPSASAGIRRIDVLLDGGSQITLRRYARGDGKPDLWQVWDMGWSDGGVSASVDKFKGMDLNSGAWITAEGTDTEIYNFTSEKEAREFHKRLRDYRIGGAGGWAKTAIRTLPPSGAITRLISGLPVVGDSFEEFMGAKEPDRKPSQEFAEGGIWAGFFNDIGIGGLPASLVGRDWATASGGVWKDNETGDTTYYFQGSNQIMESLELDFEALIKKLKLDRTKPGDVEKAANELQKNLTQRAGTPITLPPALRRALATDTGLGVGGRHTMSRWYGYTVDKNGKPKSFVEQNDNQLSWHLRGDAALGPLGVWAQDSLDGARWRTTKELDLTNPVDKRVFDAATRSASYGPTGAVSAATMLDQMWDAGVGTMSRVHYDYQVRTAIPSLNTPIGGIAFEWEANKSTATGAEYFKPGEGWLPWARCGVRGPS